MKNISHKTSENNSLPNCQLSAYLYDVPKDYFQNFTQTLLEIIQLTSQEELKLDVSKSMPFELPLSYFDSLSSSLLQTIQTQDQALLGFESNKKTSMPFKIEEDYFYHFEKQLLNKLGLAFVEDEEVEEEEMLSPLLAGLKEKNVFEVPTGYFETNPKPKVIPFELKKSAEKSIKWMRWLAAAMIVLTFGFGAWNMLNSSTIDNDISVAQASIDEKLIQIPKEAIQEYLNTNINEYDLALLASNHQLDFVDDPELILDGISNPEIEEYLNNYSF